MAADYGRAGLRHPAPPGGQLHLRAAVRRGTALRQRRRGGGDPRRLGGERHPHLERRPAVHDHGRGHRRNRHGPDLARQLRRRRGARRLRPDARRVVRRQRLRAHGGPHLRQLREQQRARAGVEVDEHEPVPLDRARRRQAGSSCASRPSTCSTGSTTASRPPTSATPPPSDGSPRRWAIRGRCSWRSSSISRGWGLGAGD